MKLRLAIVALCLAFVSTEAMAWSGLTHNAIGHIADQHLTPEAKAKRNHYLNHTLAYYASWQDEVAWATEYAETRFWHSVRFDAKNRFQYRDGRNAITHISRIWKEMRNGGYKKLDDSTIIVNLKLLTHMVGDMHCPAHVRFEDFENQGKFSIKFFGKKSTLHKVWDTSVIARDHKDCGYQGYALKLNKLSKKQVKKISAGWVEDWLEESGRDVRPHIYDVKEGDALSEEFMSWAYPLAEMQVQKAGYRLAKVLNTFFK